MGLDNNFFDKENISISDILEDVENTLREEEIDFDSELELDLNTLLMDYEFMNDDNRELDLSKYDDSEIWWLNEESQQMLNRGYLLRGETVLGAIDRICSSTAKRVACIQYPYVRVYKHFVRNVVLGFQSFSSPVWANAGLERGLPISCFNVYIGDSMSSIANKHSEVVIQTKIGGGTSGYFGELRGKGAAILNNGKSNGSVAFMRMFDTAMSVVSQGSCYKEGTKVLTQFGFVDFRNVNPSIHKIYMVNEFNQGEFTSQYELTENNFTGNMVEISGKKSDNFHQLIVTDNHRMVINKLKYDYKTNKKYWKENTDIVQAKDLNLHRDNRLPVSTFIQTDSNIELTNIERLRIAFQADGRKDKENRKIRFHFSKERKIERLISLLTSENIEFTNKLKTNYNSYEITFDYDERIKHSNFDWVNLSNVSVEWCSQFIEELQYWDGNKTKNHIKFSSIDYSVIEKVMAIAAIAGYKTSLSIREESNNRQTLYSLVIFQNTIYKSGDALKTKTYPVENEKVYCCIVPEGRIVVNYNGYTSVCGNTRRGAFAAYLDIDHPDIEDFLQIKTIGNEIQNLFTGVCVPDWWMNDMVNGGDTEKRNLWAKIIKSRNDIGLPYILFIDTINRNKPQIYKELGARIHSSNLCLTGDTIVAVSETKDGNTTYFLPLKTVVEEVISGKELYVFSCEGSNLSEFYKIERGLIQGKKDIIHVKFGDNIVKGTPDHKFMDSYGNWVELQEFVNNPELKIINCSPNSMNDNSQVYYSGELLKTEKDVEVYDITVSEAHSFHTFGTVKTGNSYIKRTIQELYEYDFFLAHNCSEICLPSTEDESFVCCLSSMNLELYDDWKDTDAVFYAIMFLDGIMSEFIEKTENYEHLEAAHKFAKRHRAIGLGVMGYHSYLQKNMIPFESWEAKQMNARIFKDISEEATQASIELGEVYGYAPIFSELNNTEEDSEPVIMMRNTTVMAIAPTTSSSSILGQVSPGIEPYSSNYFKAGLAKGNFMRKNKYLAKLLENKGMDTEDVWYSIMMKHGSVQHLDFLTPEEKGVFKTFKEISPSEIITQAAQRQQYIDQTQSLNLLIPEQMEPKDVNRILIQAWQSGIKSLYYQRSTNVSKEMMTEFVNCQSCVV